MKRYKIFQDFILRVGIVTVIGVISLLPFSCNRVSVYNGEIIPMVDKVINDTTSIYFGNFDKYPQQLDTLPIGIIASSSVDRVLFDTFLELDCFNNITGREGADGIPDFAGEKFQYIEDLANAPYSGYISLNKEDYLRELVVKDALFLLDNKYYKVSSDKVAKGEKERCKIIVIACNTANSAAIRDVDMMLKLAKLDVKVTGILNATTREVFKDYVDSQTSDSLSIGIIGLPDAKTSYRKIIDEYAQRISFKGYYNLITNKDRIYEDNALSNTDLQDSTNVVKPSLEEDARFFITSMLDQLNSDPKQVPLKSIILASNEYLSIIDTLKQIIEDLRNFKLNGRHYYAHLIAPDFKFINPMECVAKECYNRLRHYNLLAFSLDDSKVEMYHSVPNFTVDNKYLDADGNLLNDFKFNRGVGKEEETTVFVKKVDNN